ncbi:MAG: hypothetical protein IJR00_10215 [Lachnospiraceae bacterium]|nr:hypothetical protein [Lachnospiraceae bacterium]
MTKDDESSFDQVHDTTEQTVLCSAMDGGKGGECGTIHKCSTSFRAEERADQAKT